MNEEPFAKKTRLSDPNDDELTILTNRVKLKAETDQSSLPDIVNESASHPGTNSQSVIKDESESDIISPVIDQSNASHTINQSDVIHAISQSDSSITIDQSDVAEALTDQSNEVDNSNFAIDKSNEAPIELILNLSGENDP